MPQSRGRGEEIGLAPLFTADQRRHTKPDGDAALANLHIGMALARSGDKAGATAALNAVTGPRAEIAKFWLTYLAQKA